MLFYKVALRRCKCGAAAAFQIQGSGNVPYDYACARHADKLVRELIKVHNPPPAARGYPDPTGEGTP